MLVKNFRIGGRKIMMMLINKIVSSVIQIVLFVLIPLVWWAVTAKKQTTFMQWIGFKKFNTDKENKVHIWTVGTSLAFVLLGALILYALKGVETATSEFAGMGIQAIPAIMVYAVFNTALPEELLFRGFLLKRLNNKFGFTIANIIQAVLFGLLHGVMFFSLVGVIKAIMIITFTGVIAWFMGYINEKKANGSILPSWLIHSISNIFSGICSAFLII